MPRVFAIAAACVMAFAVLRVASVPTSEAERAERMDPSFSRLVGELEASVAGMRQQVAWWKATSVRMTSDTQRLRERLGASDIQRSNE